jgi:hypothetical protein
MLTHSAFPTRENFLTFFLSVSSWIIGGTILAMILAAVIYPRRWHQRL